MNCAGNLFVFAPVSMDCFLTDQLIILKLCFSISHNNQS